MSLQRLPVTARRGTSALFHILRGAVPSEGVYQAKLPRTSHYQTRLPHSALLLLKNHSLFLENRYSLQQAAILRGTFSSILSGEGFDEVERGELPFVFWRCFRLSLSLASLS